MLDPITTEEPVVGSPPAVESGEVSPPVEPATEEPEPALDAPATSDEWAGQLETIEKSEWYQKIPEDIRDAIKRGIEETYKGFQRAHTTKSQQLAEERKAFAEERVKSEETLRTERKRLNQMLYGEEDPAASVRTEWEAKEKAWQEAAAAEKASLEATTASEKRALQEQMEAAVKKAREFEDRLSTREAEWKKAQDDERGRVADSILERFEKNPSEFAKEPNFIPNMAQLLDTARTEKFTDIVAAWLQKEAKDIHDNEEAFAKFWGLLDSGESAEDAIAYIRFKNGTAQKPPSLAEEAMTVEAPPSSSIRDVTRKKKSYWEMMSQAERESRE